MANRQKPSDNSPDTLLKNFLIEKLAPQSQTLKFRKAVDAADISEKYLCIASERKLFVYDSATFEEIDQTDLMISPVTDIVISTDQSTVFICGMVNGINMRKFDNLHEKQELGTHDGKLLTMDISGDCLLSGGFDKVIKYWKYTEEQPLIGKIKVTEKLPVYDVKFGPFSKRAFAGCGDNTIKMILLKSLTVYAVLDGHKKPVTSLAISSDCLTLYSGSMDHTIKVWSINRRNLMHTFTELNEDVMQMTIDGQSNFIFAGGSKGTLKVIDMNNNQIVCGYKEFTKRIKCVKFCPFRDFVIAAGDDCKLVSYSISAPDYKVINNLPKIQQFLGSIPGQPDICYILGNKSVSYFDISTQEVHEHLFEYEKPLTCGILTEDRSSIIASAEDGKLFVYSLLDNSTQEYQFDEKIWHISQNENVLLILLQTTVLEWDLQTRQTLRTIMLPATNMEPRVGRITASHIAIGASTGEICIFERPDNNLTFVLNQHRSEVTALEFFDQDAKLLSAAKDSYLVEWNVKYGTVRYAYQTHCTGTYNLVMSADGWHAISLSVIVTRNQNHYKLLLWSLIDKTLIVAKDIDCPIKSLYLTPEYLLYFGSGKIFVQLNPFNKENIQVYPQKYSEIYKKLVIQSCKGMDTNFSPLFKDHVVLPLKVNMLHVYALSFKRFKYLQAAKAGCLYLKSWKEVTPGNQEVTPLSIATRVKDRRLREIVLKFIAEQATKQQPFVMINFDGSLPELNNSGLQNVPLLYEAAFVRPQFGENRSFGMLKSEKIISSTYSTIIDDSEFLHANANEAEIEPVQYKMSTVHFNFVPGSNDSLELLRSLEHCNDDNIMETPMIRALIAYKWQRVAKWVALKFLLFLALIVCINVIILTESRL